MIKKLRDEFEFGGEYSMFYNAKEKLLEIQDIQMNYITFGKGEKPLILIQGLSTRSIKGAAFSVAYMYRMFARDYKVYLFDRRENISDSITVRNLATDIAMAMDTLKITNAMYLISSSKLKKARKQLDATTPYFEMLQASLLDIMAHTPDLQHIFLNKRKKEHPKKGYLVMTADRGLAGAYNHNITKMAEENINEDDKLFVIGYMGRNYFGRRNAAQMDEDFFYTTQDPTIYRARRIAEKMIEEYVSGELDEVYIIYTKMITSITSEPKMIRVLPLNPDQYEFAGKGKRSHMTEFQPSVKAVLDRLAPNYIKGLVYGAMVESFSSELNARMMAMQSASNSARDMLAELDILYNRARQAAITQEITEVIAGAKSQKKKRK